MCDFNVRSFLDSEEHKKFVASLPPVDLNTPVQVCFMAITKLNDELQRAHDSSCKCNLKVSLSGAPVGRTRNWGTIQLT